MFHLYINEKKTYFCIATHNLILWLDINPVDQDSR